MRCKVYNIGFFKERDFTIETNDVIDRGFPVEDSVREDAARVLNMLCKDFSFCHTKGNYDVDEDSINEAVLRINNKCPPTDINPEGLCFLNIRLIRWKSRY